MYRERNKSIRTIALAMLLACLCAAFLTPITAFAVGKAQVTVSGPAQTVYGKEFTATATLTGNPGFSGAVFQVDYDKDVLELKSITTKGCILDDGATVNQEGGSVAYITYPDPNTKDGDLFRVTFTVKADTKAKKYNVGITLKDGLAKNFVDTDAKELPISFSDGSGSIGDSAEIADATDGSSSAPDDTKISNRIDAAKPGAGAKSAEVGSPVFVKAAEGSLTWDNAKIDGTYDAQDGGYVLTPKTAGSTDLSYTNEEDETTVIPLEITDKAVPQDSSAGKIPVIPLVIIAVVIIVAVTALFVRRKRRRKSEGLG
jgi:hypothetical protein